MYCSDVTDWAYDNFSPEELACPCCGEFYDDRESIDRLQSARDLAGISFNINSAHRCFLHNARVGGAPLSMHKKIAFDISTRGKDRNAILEACKQAGFSGFGFYNSFLHVDCGRARHWYGKGAKELWNG